MTEKHYREDAGAEKENITGETTLPIEQRDKNLQNIGDKEGSTVRVSQTTATTPGTAASSESNSKTSMSRVGSKKNLRRSKREGAGVDASGPGQQITATSPEVTRKVLVHKNSAGTLKDLSGGLGKGSSAGGIVLSESPNAKVADYQRILSRTRSKLEDAIKNANPKSTSSASADGTDNQLDF